jgi:hypothetical protein
MVTMKQKREALEAIAATNGGRLTADLIVEAARSKSHILHELFEWDQAKAARAHWLDVANEIIRVVKVQFIVENRTVHSVMYVHDPDLPDDEPGHIALTSVQSRSAKAMAIVSAELEQRIIPAIERAQELAEYLGLRRDFDVLLQNAVALRTKVARAEKQKTISGKAKPRDIAARAAARRSAEQTKPRHA